MEKIAVVLNKMRGFVTHHADENSKNELYIPDYFLGKILHTLEELAKVITPQDKGYFLENYEKIFPKNILLLVGNQDDILQTGLMIKKLVKYSINTDPSLYITVLDRYLPEVHLAWPIKKKKDSNFFLTGHYPPPKNSGPRGWLGQK